ncbi:hypothetical protein BGX33_011153 [Mortierella sp. NVP41]|nr:hypothetical protein BGX33_011153 [Mortierella sp. NVP41]
MGAVFIFRRDPSRQHKYVCVCGNGFLNPFSLRYHVEGKPSRSQRPCHLVRTKAIDIVTNNIVCNDDTKPINYRPSGSLTTASHDSDVEIMSEIDVDENALRNPNVDPDESAHYKCDSYVDHYTNPNDGNTDFHRILRENDLALDNAIKTLHNAIKTLEKTRSDIQKLL